MPSNEIHFDVIVPIYKSADYLERCLESIQNQTHPHWTCWILDGDPADDDEESRIISHFADMDDRFHYAVQDHSTHPHLSGARNQAIALGSASHIALLDSDDIWYPEHLEELTQGWIESPSSAIVSTVGEYDQDYRWQNTDKVFRRRFPLHVMDEMPPEGCDWLIATHYPALIIVPSIVSFRRDLFEAVGGFPRVRYEEDVALFSLLLREGGVSPGEGGRSFKQVPFVGAWLDWLRDGHKVSTEMHTTQKPRLLQDRDFYSMPWHNWCQQIVAENPPGFVGSGWEERCSKIIKGDWPW